MSPAPFDRWLRSAVTEVLESMCFMSADEVPVESAGASQASVTRWLRFRGPRSGSFGISTNLATARAIASNLLGEDGELITDVLAEETMGEIANMICGSLLSQFDTKQAFDLSHPERGGIGQEGVLSPARISHVFALEEGQLLTWLQIEEL